MSNFRKRLHNFFKNPFKNSNKLEEIDDNFCGFYQAVAKCINIALQEDLTEKILKDSCYEYAENSKWVKEIVIEEANQESSSSSIIKSSSIWENYLLNFKVNENIKAEIEGRIICNIYSIKIHILQNKDENWCKGTITRISPDVGLCEENVIHLINMGNFTYASCFQEHCCPRKMLEERMEDFVVKFVEEFQAKLILYKLILDGEVVKAGRFSNTYAELIGQGAGGALFGIVGYFFGIPGIASEVGKAIGGTVSKEISSKFGGDRHKEKVLNLSEIVNYFHKNPKHFLQILVKVALDIFQSYEMQFGRVSSDFNEKGTMHLLAIDAMNRAINYISICPSAMIDFHSFILNGVKFGKSKSKVIANISIVGKNDGFKIKYKYNLVNHKWKTRNLYENIGIVISEGEETKYFKKENFKKFFDYGFRRCFTYENYLELTGYKPIEINDKIKKNLSYCYVFELEEVMLKVDNFCQKIQEKEKNVFNENRLNEIIREFQGEILGELKSFKSALNKSTKLNELDHDFEILKSVKSNIKNLKIEDYKSKLLSQILQNVQDIKEEIHQVNENVSQLAESTKILINRVDNLANKVNNLNSQKHSENDHPIWFNLRHKPLTLSINRDEILELISKDLETNIVVLCGLGGMGKSELAIKYAQTNFNKDQNVIWINAESTESLIDSCSRLAQLVNVDTKDSKGNEKYLDVILTELFQKLSNRPCLFILDNVEKYSVVESFLTKITNGNKAIITSRQSADWKNEWESFRIIRVNVFSDSEAISFVTQILQVGNVSYSDEKIEELISVLGNYPLALSHALTYIRKNSELFKKVNKSFTITDYLLKFETDPLTLMETKTSGIAHQNSIFKVLKLTLENLNNEKHGKEALLILKNISFMVPNNISEMLYSIKTEILAELPYVIDLLDSYSLVTVISGHLSVHRLVQDTIRMEMEDSEKKIILEDLLQKLVTLLINWKTTIEYLPHVMSIWKFACKFDELIEKFIINEYGNENMCMPFLHLIASCEKLDLLKEIINSIKTNHSNQLIKVIDKIDFRGNSLLHLLDHNSEMVEFLKNHGANSCFIHF